MIAALLMPIVIGVVLGLAALLAALGDAPAAALCRRIGLAVGVVWLVYCSFFDFNTTSISNLAQFDKVTHSSIMYSFYTLPD